MIGHCVYDEKIRGRWIYFFIKIVSKLKIRIPNLAVYRMPTATANINKQLLRMVSIENSGFYLQLEHI